MSADTVLSVNTFSQLKEQLEQIDEPSTFIYSHDHLPNLFSSESTLSDTNNSTLTSSFMAIDNDKKAQVAQQVLDHLQELSELNEHSSSNHHIMNESPRQSHLFAFATLLLSTTKTLKSQTEQVVFSLNRAEYKLRNALTCCEVSKEYSSDLDFRAELHFLLARVLYELSFPRLDDLDRDASPSSTLPIQIEGSPVLATNANNQSPEIMSVPNMGYGTSIGNTFSLGSASGDNFLALSLDSPLRSNSQANRMSGSPLSTGSPRNASLKAAQQVQQQIESIFQEICLHMDTAIKLFDKNSSSQKKKKEEEQPPVNISIESKKAYMYYYFGDILTQWSIRRKQRWAALCSQAQEKYNNCIRICLEKLLPTLGTETICINTKYAEYSTLKNYSYCPLHHQCLYKYAVLILYWVRRIREHASIYSSSDDTGVNSFPVRSAGSNDTNLNFDFESITQAVASIGEMTIQFSEFHLNESRLSAEPSKTSSKNPQSIFKNAVASENEKLCRACVMLWEGVCNLEIRKAETYHAGKNANYHFFFRLSNAIYEYGLLLVPSASILSFNDYLTSFENLEGEPARNCSRSEVLTSSLSWHDMVFKDRMLNDKKVSQPCINQIFIY